MVYISGSNNGTFGMGASQGALYPSDMGGPFGQNLGFPIPLNLEMPAAVMDKPYSGHAFGSPTYELTPGGYTSASDWGFKNRVKSFGKGPACGPFGNFSRRRSYGRKSLRRRSYGRKSNKRCEHKTKSNKKCKHSAMKGCKFCKHHLKMEKGRKRKSKKT